MVTLGIDLHLFQKARPNTTSCFRRLRRQGRLEGITHAHLAYLAGTKLIYSNHNHHSKLNQSDKKITTVSDIGYKMQYILIGTRLCDNAQILLVKQN